MTAPQPPRWAVRLLESLGADPDFRDDVIGDMDEEFATRSAYDDERVARRWYVREAWRAFPYLIRDWARRFSRRDLAHIVGVVWASYVVVLVVGGTALVALRAVFAAMGINLEAPLPWTNPTFVYIGVPLIGLLGIGSGVLGGYVAAHLSRRRAPLISAFALGAFWVTMALCALGGMRALHIPNGTPLWWIAVQPLVVVASTTFGGALRVISIPQEPSSRTPIRSRRADPA